jgi:hypothetical protein
MATLEDEWDHVEDSLPLTRADSYDYLRTESASRT